MKRALIIVPLLAVFLLLPPHAFGYELTGVSWRLSSYPGGVPYCPLINSVDANTATRRTQFGEAIDAGIFAWTADGFGSIPGIPCSAYEALKSSCAGTPSSDPDQPWVYWEANWGSVPGVGSSTIGVTPYWSYGSEITLAKLILNDRDYYWSTDGSATDVGSIAVHEFGHFVGLDHYDEYSSAKQDECSYASSYPSVMCSYYMDGVARVPTTDDVLGVCYLYPNDGSLGSACSSGGACNSGLCHADGYCTQACPPSCPNGYDCVTGQCEREQGLPSCAQCGPMPCGTDSLCIGASGGSICTNECADYSDCPFSFYCADLEGGGGVCWPLGNSCDTGPVAGQSCAANYTCALGNVCLQLSTGGTECFKVCTTDNDCPGADRCYTLEPGIAYCDAGSTTCMCDAGSTCQAGCGCDPDCTTCACNNTMNCDPGCLCDPHCECDCNVTNDCDIPCACDPHCGPCDCDYTTACDAGCPCDLECYCTCDLTTTCDANCECDPECDDGGCRSAAGESTHGTLSLSVLLGLLLMLRRRRAQG